MGTEDAGGRSEPSAALRYSCDLGAHHGQPRPSSPQPHRALAGQSHNRYAGDRRGRGTGPKLDANRLTLMSGRFGQGERKTRCASQSPPGVEDEQGAKVPRRCPVRAWLGGRLRTDHETGRWRKWMLSQAPIRVATWSPRWWRGRTAKKSLLLAAVAAVAVYVIGDVLSGLLYDGYSYLD